MAPKPQHSKADRKLKATKGTANIDGGFISFSDVVSSVPNERATTTSVSTDSGGSSLASHIPVYLGSDSELSVIAKKLTKKNTTTRVKALSELKVILEVITCPSVQYLLRSYIILALYCIVTLSHCLQDRGQSVIGEFAPFFVFVYHRLVYDNDRNVRTDLNILLQLLFDIDKPVLRSYLPSLIGPWWMCMSDSSTVVSSRAQAAFELTFKLPHKRRAILTHLSPAICRFAREAFSAKVESLSDLSNCSLDEADERFERVLTSCMRSIGTLAAALAPPLSPPSPAEDIAAQREAEGAVVESLSGNFWKKLTSKRPAVRRAALSVLSAICQHTPHLLQRTMDSDRLTTVVCNCLQTERHVGNVHELLHALTWYPHAAPTCWKGMDLAKHLFAPLTQLLRTHAEIVLPALLPLLARVPMELLCTYHNSVTNLLGCISPSPSHPSLSSNQRSPSTSSPPDTLDITRLVTIIDLSGYLLIQLLSMHTELSPPLAGALCEALSGALLQYLGTPSVAAYCSCAYPCAGEAGGGPLRGDFQSVVSIIVALHKASAAAAATAAPPVDTFPSALGWKEVVANHMQIVLIRGISLSHPSPEEGVDSPALSLSNHADCLSFLGSVSALLMHVLPRVNQESTTLLPSHGATNAALQDASPPQPIDTRDGPSRCAEEVGVVGVLHSLCRLSLAHVRMLGTLSTDVAPADTLPLMLVWVQVLVQLSPALLLVATTHTNRGTSESARSMLVSIAELLVQKPHVQALTQHLTTAGGEEAMTAPDRLSLATHTFSCISSLLARTASPPIIQPNHARSLRRDLLVNIQSVDSVFLWSLAHLHMNDLDASSDGSLCRWLHSKVEGLLSVYRHDVTSLTQDVDLNSNLDTITTFLSQCITAPALSAWSGNMSHRLVEEVLLVSGAETLPWAGLTVLRDQLLSASRSPPHDHQVVFSGRDVARLVGRAFDLSLHSDGSSRSVGVLGAVGSFECVVEQIFPLLPPLRQPSQEGEEGGISVVQLVVPLAEYLGAYLKAGGRGGIKGELLPTQWVAGASHLLELCDSFSLSAPVDALGLPTLDFWMAQYEALLRPPTPAPVAMQFAVSCLLSLGADQNTQSPPSSALRALFPVVACPSVTVAVVKCAALCTQEHSSTRRDALLCVREQLMRQGWAYTPPSDARTCRQLKFFSTLLKVAARPHTSHSTTLAGGTAAEKALDESASFVAMRTVVQWLLLPPPSEKRLRRVSLDGVLPGDDLPKRRMVHYLNATDDRHTSTVRVTAIPCELLKVHRENPSEDPFYTLAVPAEDGGEREVQTVGSRCVCRLVGSVSVYLV